MGTILVVCASPSARSTTRAALQRAVVPRLEHLGHDTGWLSVRDLPAAPLMAADPTAPALQRAAAALDSADGVVLGTPVYKASFSGLLKVFLDVLPRDALGGKAVLPLATGDSPLHGLALDFALLPVLNSMGARHVVPGCFLTTRELRADAATPSTLERAADRLHTAVRAAQVGV
ncbi:FMN reductase [Streptomyces sp. 1222.5]|uniref:NAD(P)H-dependent oxidoreductase n=1 Tax=unclassified Streptomyces TaxID=2593676 RepID=UPI0008969C2B|nr:MULTISPECIES: NAD(P)H-dependent oxidoreductase [unclassified Streptomyces]PKW11907.1 FMN reductase [Streptomyces sp. 5112.2]SEB67137.1 FMN reductase [Streptomyces sp. 1222.5]SEE24901.1 FMN reductase [Streptomyces sp. 2231.1]